MTITEKLQRIDELEKQWRTKALRAVHALSKLAQRRRRLEKKITIELHAKRAEKSSARAYHF